MIGIKTRWIGLSAVVLLMSFSSGIYTSAPDGEKILLRLQPQKGVKYTNTMNMDMDMRMSVPGVESEMSSKMNTKMAYKLKVTDRAREKSTFEGEFTEVTLNQEIPGMQPIVYDSKDPDKNSEMAKTTIAPIYDKIFNRTFSLEVDARGTVSQGANIDSLFGIGGAQGGQSLENTFDHVFVPFPEKKVGVGDQWVDDKLVEGATPMRMKTTYEVKEIKGKTVLIALSGKISASGSDDQASMTMASGDYSGTLTVNKKTGWVEGMNISQNMKVVTAQQGQEMTMHMDSKVSIQSKKN